MSTTPHPSAIDADRFQPDRMAERIVRWSAVNSGSWNPDGLARMVDTLAQAVAHDFGEAPQRVDLPPLTRVLDTGETESVATGPALVLRRRPEAPRRVLLGIHYDTVFGPEHPFQAVREHDGKLHGPGVVDAKGGIAVMLEALRAFEASPFAERLGWTLFLNPDEEVGTLSSRPLLQELASEHDFGLVFEPALPDGSLVGARKGSGNFDVVMRGVSAHAGRDFAQGRNAVAALSTALATAAGITDPARGLTVNVARVSGGGASNIVPDLAVGRLNVRMSDPADAPDAVHQLRQAVASAADRFGCTSALHGRVTSPPKPNGPGLESLIEQTLAATRDLTGQTLAVHATGGVCDGNKLAAAGLPTLDTMGPVGGDLHSDREWLDRSSLAPRAHVAAEVLARYAQGLFDPPQRTPVIADAPNE
ncbi:MAG: hydrolase [Planctomycetota bacterium]